ncbi:hypothetical protein MPNT_150014 [Candidatus Methylacidithermus pantelleriae]|uniref:Uncharacterized protein n=1 Tax=Candidatus Methylacidithermus pantelleriae TaxID=2744239 RepID=A0A8J2FS55_9BACT|nr:hypothetical protein MPNT_150014 [Candidatus Methylacidithermus pantelleriae]
MEADPTRMFVAEAVNDARGEGRSFLPGRGLVPLLGGGWVSPTAGRCRRQSCLLAMAVMSRWPTREVSDQACMVVSLVGVWKRVKAAHAAHARSGGNGGLSRASVARKGATGRLPRGCR